MSLFRYLAGVDRAADHTPPERNRVVDTWRVIALLVVVLGHWLTASTRLTLTVTLSS